MLTKANPEAKLAAPKGGFGVELHEPFDYNVNVAEQFVHTVDDVQFAQFDGHAVQFAVAVTYVEPHNKHHDVEL